MAVKYCLSCGCMLDDDEAGNMICGRCEPNPEKRKKVRDLAADKGSKPAPAGPAGKDGKPSGRDASSEKEEKVELGGKILIIDDEPLIVKVLSKRLEANGFLVLTASDGEEGYEMIRKERPDMVLSDILMPKMTGYELVQKLQKDKDGLDKIPVLIMTAKPSMKEFFSDWEIYNFMSKPIDPEELLAKIRVLMETAQKIKKQDEAAARAAARAAEAAEKKRRENMKFKRKW